MRQCDTRTAVLRLLTDSVVPLSGPALARILGTSDQSVSYASRPGRGPYVSLLKLSVGGGGAVDIEAALEFADDIIRAEPTEAHRVMANEVRKLRGEAGALKRHVRNLEMLVWRLLPVCPNGSLRAEQARRYLERHGSGRTLLRVTEGPMSDTPRRCEMTKWTPAELAIYEAIRLVESLPADVRLTDAVVLLGEAKESVADFIDGVMVRRGVDIHR